MRDAAPESLAGLAETLASLPLGRLRLGLSLHAPLGVPPLRRGVVFRGALGLALRGLVCPDLRLDCAACELRAGCAYPPLFAPGPSGGRLTRLRDVPRPFVVAPSLEAESAARFELDLTLVGHARAQAALFVRAFETLGAEGVGPARARFTLADAAWLDLRTLRPARPFVPGEPPPELALRGALARPEDEDLDRVTLRVLTPLQLKSEGRVVEPSAGVLVRRLRDRVSALFAFAAGAPAALPHALLGERADTLATVSAELRHVELRRRSRRTGERHPMGGVVGELTLAGGALAALMPLLRLGELTHVGRHAAFGHGRYVLGLS